MSNAPRSTRLGLITAFAALALSVSGGLAQTPVASPAPDPASHPAHIHAGTCAELGDVVAPLTNVATPGGDITEQVGPPTAHQVKISITTVDVPLAELVSGSYAINVHLSDADMGEYIACGDIGGVVVAENDGRSELNFGLRELNGSGYVGTVWLGAQGDETDVKVILIEPDKLT